MQHEENVKGIIRIVNVQNWAA